MQITVERVGRNPAVDLERMFERIAKPDKRQLTSVASAVRKGFDENFASESSAAGPWTALAAATVAERIAQGYGGEHPILRRTGSLRASFVQDGGDHVERFTPEGDGWLLEVGSAHELAAIHERGAQHIPARPISPLSAQSEARIGAAVAYVIDQIEKAALRR